MADALVSRHIPALHGGISQQNPTLRRPSQAEAQVNMLGTVQDGLRKRPPSQHIAVVTSADLGTAYVHAINRDVSERYIVVISDGDLEVYNANTGVEQTVNFPVGKDYLDIVGGGAASASFSADSVADYTFVVNKTKVTATKTAPTTTPTNYSDWYWPNTWGNPDHANYFNSYGNHTVYGTVNTFSDLPGAGDASPPTNGQMYKVVGYDENNFGGYYVKREGGVWVETYGPNANTAMDEETLPHALVREADGTFTFTEFGFASRQFGDAATNPPPTFIGRTINGVFYWKNRLGFITDENVVFSGAGDYGNFWRNTLTTLLDSDVVDVAMTTNQVAFLNYALPLNGNMMLFSDQGQFSLNVRDVLSPTSVSIDKATGYEMDVDVKPIALGSEVYFVSQSGDYSRLREYFTNNETLNTDAADVTAHVQSYVPSGIFKITGNSVEDVVFAVSNKVGHRNRIYSYKFFWSGDQKAQSAWSYWEMGTNDIILSIDAIEDDLFVLVKRSDGTFLEKIDIDRNAETLNLGWDIMLDRRYEIQVADMAYSAGTGLTTITLPFQHTEDTDVKIVKTTPAGHIGSLVDPSTYLFPTTTTITVTGDITDKEPVFGVNYDASYRFSQQFVYNSNGDADTTGNLQLRTMTVNFKDMGFFSTRVYPYGLSFAADVETVVPSALDAFTGRTLGEASLITGEAAFHTGTYQFFIDGNSKDVVIDLINDSHLPGAFTSVEWEGLFTKRTRGF